MSRRIDGPPIDVALRTQSRFTNPQSAESRGLLPSTLDRAGRFGTGLKPIEIVAVLPPAGAKGRVVFLSTDNKLYRDDGAAWTVATDGADILAGSITAAKLAVSQLSAIVADLGIITAGQMHNVGNDAGILLTGALPGAWTRYLDLVSSHVTMLKHDKLSLNYDGSAVFNGILRSQVGLSTSTTGPVQLLGVGTNITRTNAVEASMATVVVPANGMGTNGDTVRIHASGHFGSISGIVDVKFGATNIAHVTAGCTPWTLTALVSRTGAATQRWTVEQLYGSCAPTFQESQGSAAETLSGAVTIDFQGADGSTVTLDHYSVEYLGA